jgi:IS30 family transposase
VKEWLFSPEGREFLVEQYQRAGRSTHSIAAELNTYAKFIARALKHHGIPARSRSEAQAQALKSGRHGHPTRGKGWAPEQRARIGEGVARAWERMGDAEYERRVVEAKARYEAMGEGERGRLVAAAGEGTRRAAVEGSRLEKYLFLLLSARG